MFLKYITLFFFLCTSILTAQQSQWILDTMYTKSIFYDNARILYNNDKAMVLEGLEVKPFQKIEDHFSTLGSENTLIKVEGKTYLLNEGLIIDYDLAIDLDFNTSCADFISICSLFKLSSKLRISLILLIDDIPS